MKQVIWISRENYPQINSQTQYNSEPNSGMLTKNEFLVHYERIWVSFPYSTFLLTSFPPYRIVLLLWFSSFLGVFLGLPDRMNTLLKWQILSCHAHTKCVPVCCLPLSSAYTVRTSRVLHFYVVKSVSVCVISSITFKVRNRNQVFILAFCDFTFIVNFLFFKTEI